MFRRHQIYELKRFVNYFSRTILWLCADKEVVNMDINVLGICGSPIKGGNTEHFLKEAV